jgi:integrase
MNVIRRCRSGGAGTHLDVGLATNLHDLRVDDETIQAILRHSNVQVTQRSYIKTLPQQTVDAMEKFNERIDSVQ